MIWRLWTYPLLMGMRQKVEVGLKTSERFIRSDGGLYLSRAEQMDGVSLTMKSVLEKNICELNTKWSSENAGNAEQGKCRHTIEYPFFRFLIGCWYYDKKICFERNDLFVGCNSRYASYSMVNESHVIFRFLWTMKLSQEWLKWGMIKNRWNFYLEKQYNELLNVAQRIRKRKDAGSSCVCWHFFVSCN